MRGMDSTPAELPVISVSELNRTARDVLTRAFPRVHVEGEISNLRRPRSGHLYFTLKDDQAQVDCAMFRGKQRHMAFEPADGQQVLVRAAVDLYQVRGQFQLNVHSMEEAGAGALQRAFEALKQRLEAEGLFAEARKQALPRLPRRVGVITSSSGAALHDILTVLARRFPAIEVVVYPVPVQGEQAAPAIAAALARAGRRSEVDVLIVGRGGGSLEDLWPFNEEEVARAIAACPLPVVSAVGHETDVTIADLAADRRAPTPTAAAELVSPDGEAWARQLATLEQRLNAALHRRLTAEGQRLTALQRRLREPRRRLQDLGQRLDELDTRLRRSMERELAERRRRLHALHQRLRDPRRELQRQRERTAELRQRLERAMGRDTERRRQRLQLTMGRLQAASPLGPLDRGFALLQREDGGLVRSPADAPVGTRLHARLDRAGNALKLDVIEIENAPDNQADQ
ncbi:Exodeoxyribonuclease VII large subunit [Thiohalospira halophila DSM 15071]|uniref:Exodeoxyribonuclease 7 large subunit n=2 Tax=Thiohalospira halophila TaxID=381300 RepID=A0A1I1WGJ5_9GAMM|nr:Exodeoxyribonuclease VII large subunit [Thiohalospira halophila DSM 15071]